MRTSMSDLDKNIHRKDGPAPFEKIVVNPIEKERREKDKDRSSFQSSSRSQTFAALISYLKKILTAFGSKEKYTGYLSHQKQLAEDAFALRELLLNLAKEDLSHHPDFTQKLGNYGIISWMIATFTSPPEAPPPKPKR